MKNEIAEIACIDCRNSAGLHADMDLSPHQLSTCTSGILAETCSGKRRNLLSRRLTDHTFYLLARSSLYGLGGLGKPLKKNF
jgi:hypothetical protein